MSTLWIYVYLIGGVIALYVGAEILVMYASRFALSLGMSYLTTGLTIVAIATSTPELVSSLMAQLQGGYSNIAFGNIVGSNIANIGLILGAVALFRPVELPKNVLRFEAPAGVFLVIALFMMMLTGKIGRGFGILLLLGFVTYLIWHVHEARKCQENNDHPLRNGSSTKKMLYLVLIFVGAGITVAGGYFFIQGAIAIANRYHVAPRVIGLTLVAVGSSLPEFAASFVALMRKNPELAIGNIFGSNVLNILMVLGVVACVQPIHFAHQFLLRDLPIALVFALAGWLFGLKKMKISRLGGGMLLAGYACYLYFAL